MPCKCICWLSRNSDYSSEEHAFPNPRRSFLSWKQVSLCQKWEGMDIYGRFHVPHLLKSLDIAANTWNSLSCLAPSSLRHCFSIRRCVLSKLLLGLIPSGVQCILPMNACWIIFVISYGMRYHRTYLVRKPIWRLSCSLTKAPQPEYTTSGCYRSNAAGSSPKALLAFVCCRQRTEKLLVKKKVVSLTDH